MSAPAPAAARFRSERELGRHGSAVTYLATEVATGRALVLKRFRLGQALPSESPAIFEERAKILARLDHPGLPRYVAFSRRSEGLDEVCELVLEHAPGESLAAAVAGGRRFTEEEVRDLLRRGAGILSYLHRQAPPLVHRNVRPSNLILGPDGALRMTDLEFLARPVSADPVVTFGVPWLIGGCTPPEALRGEFTPAGDVFSLGVVAIVALTGREPPFRGGEAGGWRAESLVAASPTLTQILARMTAPRPEARYADADTLAAALAPPPAPPPRPLRRRGLPGLGPARPAKVVQVALLATLLAIAGKRWQRTWEWLHPEISGPVLSQRIPPAGAPERPAPSGARLRSGRTSHAPGEPIVVAYERMSGSRTDWVTLVPEEAATNTYAEWHYTGGGTRGTVTFAGLPPGRYEVRAYFDWPRGGYAVRGRAPVSVVAR